MFEATLRGDGKRIYLGRFQKADDAARAYDKKAAELFGEFVCLNFPQEREQETEDKEHIYLV